MTLSSRHGDKNGDLFGMDAQGDALDDMRMEASGILQMQYERGNDSFVKHKYVTLTIEAENLPAARARFSRIEADTRNRFKVMGAGARVLDGKEQLALLHRLIHPEGGQFAFEWDWLPVSGLSVKNFISPSSFEFGETRRFRVGEMYGAVSFCRFWPRRFRTVSSRISWMWKETFSSPCTSAASTRTKQSRWSSARSPIWTP